LINALASKGIFIVPKGTLESWAPEVEPKVRFAELAPTVIQKNKALSDVFEKFVIGVLEYIEIKFTGTADRVAGGLKTKSLEAEKAVLPQTAAL
jgi:hypothetical protein